MDCEHLIQTTPVISGPSIRFLARAYSSTFFSTSGDPSTASPQLRSPLSGPRAEAGAR